MKGFSGNNNNNNGNVRKLRPNETPKTGDSKAELVRLREQIVALIEKKPKGAEKAATILADWLKQGQKSNQKKAG